MRNQPIPLITGFYNDADKPWSMQDVCNWLPCASESPGTRTTAMLKTPPGLSPFLQHATGKPMRAVYAAEGNLFSVSANTLFQVNSNGTTAVRGEIPGVGVVRAAHNQITGGNEVLFVNGSAGYVWNTAELTFQQITDTGYPGAFDAVFIDGYLVQIEPGRRFAFHSDLANALAYNTLDRFTSEVSPDPLVGLAACPNNELLLLSTSTGEFFENTGANQQPFRSKRISFQRGCAGRYTIATLDNTVMWLGDDGMFYKLDGYSPRRISTRPIEQAIRGLNWSQAIAYVWETEGHSVCYWTFPDGLTFGYDPSQPPGLDWHRRASYGLDRWRVNGTAFWQNRWIASDFQHPYLWEFDWDYPMEGDVEMVSEITGPVMHDNQNLVLMPRLELVMDTGAPLVAARDFPPPIIALSISGDLPGGLVGDSGTMQYDIVGGIPPYVVDLVPDEGTLPPGATMDSDGLVTYDYTETGFYAWVPRVIDSVGTVATTEDDALIGGEIFMWRVEDPVAAQVGFATFISGDVMVIAHANGRLSYSLDRGYNWTINDAVIPSAPALFGVVKFGADWYVFGHSSGTPQAARATGDSFEFEEISIPFQPGESEGECAFVIDDAIYVAERCVAGNLQFNRSIDVELPWATVDTGIAGEVNDSICSHAETSDGWHLFGTQSGKVLRTNNMTDFALIDVDTVGGGSISIAALGTTVLACANGSQDLIRSTDSGATFGAPMATGGHKVLANGAHFIFAAADQVYTSPTGLDGSWTNRLDADNAGSGVYTGGQGYATADLAFFPTFGTYCYIGDIA